MSESRCLLLVEDDDTTREVLTLLLESDRWIVRAAASGEAALRLLEAGDVRPEAMVCDLNLPGLQGTALAERLRTYVPGVTLLAASASAIDAPPAGYDAMLRKPFGADEVRAALAGVRLAGDADASDETPVLDGATLLLLQKQMGVRAKDLYAFALADAGDRLERMRHAQEVGDSTEFRKEAHALKGAAGMIGARRLAGMASRAEVEGAAGDAAGSPVVQMQLACEEIRLMLETLFPV